MPHISFEAIAILFAVLVWVISGIVKGLKWLGAQLGGTNARPTLVQEALADVQRQAALTARPQAQPEPERTYSPARTISPARTSPPPVRYKTSAAEFISQEQALQAEQVSRLGIPLTSSAVPLPAQTAPLFGDVDDLVRALILQEVLGPPLSKRKSSQSQPPVSHQL